MERVSKEVATSEVNNWLEFKKISDKKKESYKDNIEALVDAISEGTLSYNPESNMLVQSLKFPLEGESKISTLSYKPRVKLEEVHAHLNGVKASDVDGRVVAYIAALTGQVKNVIKKLDTEDVSLANSIAVFFI